MCLIQKKGICWFFSIFLLILFLSNCSPAPKNKLKFVKKKPIPKGLVICNYKNPESKAIKRITDILAARGFAYRVIPYKSFSLKKIESFDFVILSGGDISIAKNKELNQEKKLCRLANIPIFGICAGFQAIASAYGYRTVKLSKREKGLQTIQLIRSEMIGLEPTVSKLTVSQNHRWSVRKIGKEFQIIGISKNGIEIFLHKTKPILATQFHPEIKENNQGILVLDFFLENTLFHERSFGLK